MNTMHATCIELRSVNHRFGKTEALKNIDLDLPEGNIIGLLGRNGCGKSTLLNIVSGKLVPSSGECRTLGVLTTRLGDQERERIGMVPQEIRLIDWLSVSRHLKFIGGFYRNWDEKLAVQLTRTFDLDPGARVGTLSPGNRQKLAIIAALCHHPDLVLLDEPVSALDPITRAGFLEHLFEQVSSDGCTVIVSSHVLTDVEKLVNRIICLNKGTLRVDADLDELKESLTLWEVTASSDQALPDAFPEPFVMRTEGTGHQRLLVVRDVCPSDKSEFSQRYNAQVKSRPMNLETLFPLLIDERIQL